LFGVLLVILSPCHAVPGGGDKKRKLAYEPNNKITKFFSTTRTPISTTTDHSSSSLATARSFLAENTPPVESTSHSCGGRGRTIEERLSLSQKLDSAYDRKAVEKLIEYMIDAQTIRSTFGCAVSSGGSLPSLKSKRMKFTDKEKMQIMQLYRAFKNKSDAMATIRSIPGFKTVMIHTVYR
jgi:hypothetical protein